MSYIFVNISLITTRLPFSHKVKHVTFFIQCDFISVFPDTEDLSRTVFVKTNPNQKLHIHFSISSIDVQKKQPDNDCAPKPASSSSQEEIFCNETNSSTQTSTVMSMSESGPSSGEVGAASLPASDGTAIFSFLLLFSLLAPPL